MSRIYTAGMSGSHPSFICADCEDRILPGQLYKMRGRNKTHLKPSCERAGSKPASRKLTYSQFSERRCPTEYPRSANRMLRSYSRQYAEKEYTCHECRNDKDFDREPDLATIFPGDEYYAEVWLIRGRLEIRRFHKQCPCPPPPEGWDRKEEETEDEEDVWLLPMAA